MKVYARSNNSSLNQTCDALGKLAYAVEDLSAEDRKEFESVTGITVDDLLDAYKDLKTDLNPV